MKLDGLRERVGAAIDAALGTRIVGTVLIVLKDGEMIYKRSAGLIDREAGIPMREDAIFRLASLTKPLVSATALAMVEAGLLGLDDNVTDHLPYFAPTWERRPIVITVRQLMTHTSGLSYDPIFLSEVDATPGQSGPIIPLDENVRRIGGMRLKFAPGTGWEYGVSIDVLGCLVAMMNRSTLDEAIQHYVTGPLGMNDTRFGVTDIGRLAVPYANTLSGKPVRMGDTHQTMNPDGTPGPIGCPSRIFNPMAPQSGGSGMAGSGSDFVRFLETIRAGGAPIFLKPETVADAMRNQIGDIPRPDPSAVGRRFGLLGELLEDPLAAQSPCAKGTLSWGGIYGHHWFVDPANGLAVVSMSNTALEGCNGPYRDEIRDAVYG